MLKTIAAILTRAAESRCTPIEVIEHIYDGRMSDVKPSCKGKIAPFVEVVRALRQLAAAGENPGTIIEFLLELVEYRAYLKDRHTNWDIRWENVQDLVSFASEFSSESP